MTKESMFSNDWLDIQRKYWESWTEMSRNAMGTQGGDITKPWESAMDHWWQALSPGAPDASKDFMEKMMDQGKAFFRMAQTFVPGNDGNLNTDGWGALTKTLEDLQSKFAGSADESGDALHRMMAFWELPYDNWQRMMSSMSPMPGDLLRNMPHDHVQGHVDRVLSAPGLGYTREEQSQYQDLIRRSMDYQKALQEYLGFYSQLGVKSVQRMRSYMQGVIDKGESIDSARAIYDNWVACCEAVYADEVTTPEYARIHGQLVNAQMAFKNRMAIMVDESLGAMNMPSRSELRTLQDRLQETRRENKTLRRDLNRLMKQFAEMSGEEVPVARAPARALSSAPAARPRPVAATKKTVARKKAPVKPSTD